MQHFQRARSLARENNDNESAQEALVNCGIVNAEIKWDDAKTRILGNITACGTYGS